MQRQQLQHLKGLATPPRDRHQTGRLRQPLLSLQLEQPRLLGKIKPIRRRQLQPLQSLSEPPWEIYKGKAH